MLAGELRGGKNTFFLAVLTPHVLTQQKQFPKLTEWLASFKLLATSNLLPLLSVRFRT